MYVCMYVYVYIYIDILIPFNNFSISKRTITRLISMLIMSTASL